MAVNVRAPGAPDRALCGGQDAGEDSLDREPAGFEAAAPNPDYLSYTLSKQALAGLTELAARALAPRGYPSERHRARR